MIQEVKDLGAARNIEGGEGGECHVKKRELLIRCSVGFASSVCLTQVLRYNANIAKIVRAIV